MSREFRQMILEQKIAFVSPAPMVAALRIRGGGLTGSRASRSGRPRKRASSTSAKPRKSPAKARQALNPQIGRAHRLDGPKVRKPRKRRGGNPQAALLGAMAQSLSRF